MLQKDASGALGLYCHKHKPEFASSVGRGGLLGPLPHFSTEALLLSVLFLGFM